MLETFEPLLRAAQGIALDDPASAWLELNVRLDPQGEEAASLNLELKTLLDEGRIADRGELPVRWGRVAKPSEESLGFSIDVVLMNGAGPRHRHPLGEVNYCIAMDGAPTFQGQGPGWVVESPGSEHVPTVTGGTMLIVYLLPEGSMEFIES